MEVKIQSQPRSAGFIPVFWLFYFISSISILGSVLAMMICVPFYLLAQVFPRTKTWADRCLLWSVQLLLRVQPWLHAKADFESIKPLPLGTPGRLLVSNHRSHLDVFFLLSGVQGVRIFAKETLFSVPFLGLLMRLSQQIPVKQGHVQGIFDSLEIARKYLRTGENVHIFPEMTRCQAGHVGTLSFSAAPFAIALQEKISVTPIVFEGTDTVWPKGSKGLLSEGRIRVRTLEPVLPHFQSAAEFRDAVQMKIRKAME